MKLLRLVLALSFAALLAHVTAADSTDPVIGFGGTGSLTPTSCSAGTTSLDDSTACNLTGSPVDIGVTIPSDATGTSTYIVDVYNSTGDDDETGVDLMSLTITDTDLPAGETLGCGAPTEYFATVTQTGPDSCTFTGEGSIPDDLPPGYAGGIYVTGFDAGSSVALLVTTPEPSSILLLGIGLLSLFGVQKRRGIAKSEA